MEFEVSELGINLVPAHVDVFGLDEKIEQADAMLNELDNLVIDEHTEKYAKAKRAEVNKFIKALSSERIANTKAAQGNWPETAEKIMSLEKRGKATTEVLGAGVKLLDEQRRVGKLEMVNAEIAKITNQFNIEPSEIKLDDRWLNSSYSWPQMRDDIAEQAEKVVSDREQLAVSIELIEANAEMLNLEPAGYVGMLTNGIELKVVRQQMATEVKTRESRLQAKKERDEQLAKEHAKRMESATKIGNKMVDTESGEVIEEPKPLEHDYLFKLKMTEPQYEQMKANFKKWGIYVNDKQV